jgi:hypothetical protein
MTNPKVNVPKSSTASGCPCGPACPCGPCECGTSCSCTKGRKAAR